MSKVAKQLDRFTETEVDDEIVVMRLDNGEFFSLAGTAAETWRLIDGTLDRAEIVAQLARHYGTEQSAIATDVDDFLAQLSELGLLATA